jgi:hypothetical protein
MGRVRAVRVGVCVIVPAALPVAALVVASIPFRRETAFGPSPIDAMDERCDRFDGISAIPSAGIATVAPDKSKGALISRATPAAGMGPDGSGAVGDGKGATTEAIRIVSRPACRPVLSLLLCKAAITQTGRALE